MGLEGVDRHVIDIAEILSEEEDEMSGMTSDAMEMPSETPVEPSDMPEMPEMPEEPAPEGQWVVMCHGEEDGKKVTEVWGTYPSREAAVQDLKDCIRDEWDEETLKRVEADVEAGYAEVDGWIKSVVQMKSPESVEE